MRAQIGLHGIEVRARHGVLDYEKQNDQLFQIDVELTLDLAGATADDDLAQTVDYGTLAESISRLVSTESHDLIETVAARIAEEVMEDERIEHVVVTVHKPEAPIEVPFSDVTVTVERAR